jgi:RND family efflux transporter MFP subunit
VIILTTGAYAGILLLLIKFGVFKQWVGWMTASVVGVFVVPLLVFVIPMNFGAPSGPVVVLKRSVQISPNIAGPVIEVSASQNTPVLKNDILFEIDPVPFQAAVDSLSAKLGLAELRLEQASKLAARQVGSQFDVQQYDTEVSGLKADLRAAKWNLDQTSVKAPTDGWVPIIALRPGMRVTPGQAVMSLVDESSTFLAVQIEQINTRHIKPGDEAEVIFKVFPGQIFIATVVDVVKANSTGLVAPGASSIDNFNSAPFLVRLSLSESEVALPAGAVGTAAIYTDQFQGLSHIIRKIILHQQNWKNYLQI